jgi:hypothetical protein
MVQKSIDQEQLSEMGIEAPKQLVTKYYDKSGKICEQDRAVAKVVELPDEDNKNTVLSYYVKHGRGQVFDPYGIDMHKTNAYNFQFKKVDEEIFTNYNKYLSTRREIYLISARRAFINKGY